jgi:tRNA pseudouridine55 synthase
VADLPKELQGWNGALLIDKHAGVSSFGIIELLQRSLTARFGLKRRELPKIGHGGTLDPFATGLLVVCVGQGVKLSRYFLGSAKAYAGQLRFGETTVPGDPTAPISEKSEVLPASLEELCAMARKLQAQPYLQTPPMHSAKKQGGKPLYELAREGKEVEREAKLCHLHDFEFLSYEKPEADFRVSCSSGTYIRTLAQDFARLMGSVGMLTKLERTRSGSFTLDRAMTTDSVAAALEQGRTWPELPAWIPFDQLLMGFARAEATEDEAQALTQGRQNVLFNILRRAEAAAGADATQVAAFDDQNSCLAIYTRDKLLAIARREAGVWGLERVFLR